MRRHSPRKGGTKPSPESAGSDRLPGKPPLKKQRPTARSPAAHSSTNAPHTRLCCDAAKATAAERVRWTREGAAGAGCAAEPLRRALQPCVVAMDEHRGGRGRRAALHGLPRTASMSNGELSNPLAPRRGPRRGPPLRAVAGGALSIPARPTRKATAPHSQREQTDDARPARPAPQRCTPRLRPAKLLFQQRPHWHCRAHTHRSVRAAGTQGATRHGREPSQPCGRSLLLLACRGTDGAGAHPDAPI